MLEVSSPPPCVPWWDAVLPVRSGARAMRSFLPHTTAATAVCAAFGFILLLTNTLAVISMASFPASFQPHLTIFIRGKAIRPPHASKCPL